MKHEISLAALCEVLRIAYNCETCSIDSIEIRSENGMKKIQIGSGGMLDLYMDLND